MEINCDTIFLMGPCDIFVFKQSKGNFLRYLSHTSLLYILDNIIDTHEKYLKTLFIRKVVSKIKETLSIDRNK